MGKRYLLVWCTFPTMVFGLEQGETYAEYGEDRIDEFDLMFALSILVSVFVFVYLSITS